MHVQMAYRIGEPELDKVYRFARGDGSVTVIEFDVPRGVYRLALNVPKYGCATTDYLDFLPDHERTINETLVDGPPGPPKPVFLMEGAAPLSFQYVKPTFVLFDKTLVCNQPIDTPIPSHFSAEYDQGAYHVWLYSDPTIEAHAPAVVALRLRTPTGTAHYVRVPITFPTPWAGWPSNIQFDVTEDMIDGLTSEKVDTLLCPKLWETSAH